MHATQWVKGYKNWCMLPNKPKDRNSQMPSNRLKDRNGCMLPNGSKDRNWWMLSSRLKDRNGCMLPHGSKDLHPNLIYPNYISFTQIYLFWSSQHFLFCYFLEPGCYEMCDIFHNGCIIMWAILTCGKFYHVMFWHLGHLLWDISSHYVSSCGMYLQCSPQGFVIQGINQVQAWKGPWRIHPDCSWRS